MLAQRVLDDVGCRVHRGTHGKVNDPVGMGRGKRLDFSEAVPGKIWQPDHPVTTELGVFFGRNVRQQRCIEGLRTQFASTAR